MFQLMTVNSYSKNSKSNEADLTFLWNIQQPIKV